MTWLWPEMLWLLLLVPAVVAIYLVLLRRKKKTALRYASLSIMRDALGTRIYEGTPEILALAVTEAIYATDDDF